MRKLLAFALPFSAAIFALRYHALPLLLLLAAVAAWKKDQRRLRLFLLCLGLGAGLLWSAGYDAVFVAPARALWGQTLPLEVTVADFPAPTRSGVRVTVELRPEQGPKLRALAYLDGELADLVPGDGLSFTALLRPADRLRDEHSDLYPAKGVFLLLYPRGGVSLTPCAQTPARFLPRYWARSMKDSIAAAFPPDAAPLVQAVVTGDKSALSELSYAALSRAGLAHTVAVSGMHLSFLAALLLALTGRHRRRAALLTIPILLLFTLVAGCTPSVVRAAVMQCLLLLAPLCGRENDTPTALSLALLLLLAQNPYAAASVSLQLSFASVAGILLFTPQILDATWGKLDGKQPEKWPGRLLRSAVHFVLASVATTVGALALTTPLLAYYFGQISLVAILSNLLSLWAISFVFLGGLAVGVSGFFLPGFAAFAALAVTPLVRYLLWLVPILADLPYAAVTLEGVYFPGWLLFTYGVAVLLLAWRGGGRRLIAPLCCCAIAFLAAALFTRMSYEAGPLTATILATGQGQSVVLRAGERIALIDCGGSDGNAGDIAADYLRDRGRERIDLLVLTHFHADHANGVLELFQRMEVSVLAVPTVDEESPLRGEILAAAASHGTQILPIEANATLPFGRADLTLYAPLGAGDANEAGLSVLCQSPEFSALFTGDMDGAVEKRLVKYGDLPDVDLLVAGHHGSKRSSSQLLLDTVMPELVVASVGYNTYGHPAPETVARIDRAGADFYRTDKQGNITIRVG